MTVIIYLFLKKFWFSIMVYIYIYSKYIYIYIYSKYISYVSYICAFYLINLINQLE